MEKTGNITFKFLSIIFSLLFFSMIIFSFIFYIIENITIQNSFNQNIKSLTDRLAFTLTEPLWVSDKDAIEKIINYEKINKNIIGIAIKDDTDEVIFSKKRDNKGEFVEFDINQKIKYYKSQSRDILKNENKLGSIEIFFTDSVNKRALFMSIIKIVIMFIAFFFILFIFLYIAINTLILKKLITIFSYIKDLSKGEINKKININSNDEIGVLTDNLNFFSKNLQEITGHIKRIIKVNFDNSIKIDNDAKNISNTTNDICKSMESIQSQTECLNTEIEKSHNSIIGSNSIVSLIDSQVKEQKKSIIETSTIVQNIIKTLEDLSVLALKNKDISNSLSDIGKTGSENMNETIASIKGITDLTDIIKGMIDAIGNISQKINLLSINAAIEAAHAGNSGMGFAIVANEIRSLSDETKNSIDGISRSLISIISKIDDTKKITLKTKESMENIITGINEEESNQQNMIKVYDELITQNNDMEKVFYNLVAIITSTEKSSSEVNLNYKDIQNSILEIQKLSDINLKSVIAINVGIIQISKMLTNISTQGLENTKIVGEIESEMNYFKN